MEIQGCQQQQSPLTWWVPIKTLVVPHKSGQIIHKPFGNIKRLYKGKIVHHDAREKLYKVLYEDGNALELSHEEILKYTKAPIDTSATQFERVEQEYWTAQQSGRRRSPRIKKLQVPYTGGFANAVEHLQSTWYHRNDWIPHRNTRYMPILYSMKRPAEN